MPVGKELQEIEQRRRLLLAQSGLHRATLELQFAAAAESLRWLDAGVRVGRRAGPWLIALAPLAGFLVARKSAGLLGIARRSLPLAKVALRLLRK